jgi:hypothetical protein
MIRFIFSCMLFLIFSTAAFSGVLPPLTLDNGANRVSLVLLNNGKTDLSHVTVSVAPETLPVWLSVQCDAQAVNAVAGAQAQQKLFLVLTVTDAPKDANAVVPLTFTDTLGNRWSHTVSVSANAPLPVPDALVGNFPNPFNPDTVISYSISSGRNVRLAVFNSLGQKVRTLMDGPVAAGKHTAVWNGCDDSGRIVSSGMYFAKMESGGFMKTVKLLFAR